MNVSVVIATCGRDAWADLAWSRAYPSADAQEPRPEIVVEHHPDLSVAAARNAAAARASRDLLCFLDADDELEPGYLAAMAARSRSLSVEVHKAWPRTVGGIGLDSPLPLLVPAVRRIWPDCREAAAAIPNRGRWPHLNECVIGTIIDRDLFETLGGFRDLPSLEDYDLFLRAYDAGAWLVYVEDAVYRECVSASGRNRDQSAYARIWADHLAR